MARKTKRYLSREDFNSIIKSVFDRPSTTRDKSNRASFCIYIFEFVYVEGNKKGIPKLNLEGFVTETSSNKPKALQRLQDETNKDLNDSYAEKVWRKLGYRFSIEKVYGSQPPKLTIEFSTYPKGKPVDIEIKEEEIKKEKLGSRFNVEISKMGGRFVGRDEKLKEIEEKVEDDTHLGVNISGPSGIGKSQLAAEYAWRKKNKYPGGCLWITDNLKVKNHENAFSLLLNLGIPLGIEFSPEINESERCSLILDSIIKEKGKTLIVIDDVKDWKFISQLVHKISMHHILLTSKNHKLSPYLKNVTLERITNAQGLDLFFSYALSEKRLKPKKQSKEYKAAEKITEWMGGLPLALELAGCYLYYSDNEKFTEFQKKLEKKGFVETLELPQLGGTFSRHKPSIIVILETIFDLFNNNPKVKTILSRFIYFAEIGVKEDLVAQATNLSMNSEKVYGSSELEDSLKPILEVGLLKINDGKIKLSHDLVRKFLTDLMTDDEKIKSCRAVAQTWYEYFDEKSGKIFKKLDDLYENTDHLAKVVISIEELSLEKEFYKFFFNLGLGYRELGDIKTMNHLLCLTLAGIDSEKNDEKDMLFTCGKYVYATDALIDPKFDTKKMTRFLSWTEHHFGHDSFEFASVILEFANALLSMGEPLKAMLMMNFTVGKVRFKDYGVLLEVEYLLIMGKILEFEEKYEDAVNTFMVAELKVFSYLETAQKIKMENASLPSLAYPSIYAGRTHMKIGDYELAIDNFENAIKILKLHFGSKRRLLKEVTEELELAIKKADEKYGF